MARSNIMTTTFCPVLLKLKWAGVCSSSVAMPCEERSMPSTTVLILKRLKADIPPNAREATSIIAITRLEIKRGSRTSSSVSTIKTKIFIRVSCNRKDIPPSYCKADEIMPKCLPKNI